MTDPHISVIVPVYNGAGTIETCIESLLDQRGAPPYEVLIVENGSTDDTSEVVARYPVRLLHSDQRGPAAARNHGIAHSAGAIIAFTDADCIADPDWLAHLSAAYADPQIVGVGGAIIAYTHAQRNLVERFSDDQAPLINFISGEGEFLPHLYTANASYRRAVLDAMGGFNPHLLTGEDVDLAWRVQLQTGGTLAYAPDAIIRHRHRSSVKRLARQYRQYGFGEIMLDTLYGSQPGYPRTRAFQARRMLRQAAALPRYGASILIRRVRRLRGRASEYDALVPVLNLLIEGSNLLGKIDALYATRLMTRPPDLVRNIDDTIRKFY